MNAGARTGCTNCCVVGCHNNYSNTDRNVKFYSFPGRPYEKERKEQWIKSINRKTFCNGKEVPWRPSKYSRICSQHFINNKKSDDPRHPSYVPTIFPKVYGRNINVEAVTQRFTRVYKRTEKKDVLSAVSSNEDEDTPIPVNFPEKEVSKNFSCQVNFDSKTEEDSFLFECIYSSHDGNVGTQVNIPKTQNFMLKQYTSKCVGPDEESEIKCVGGFHGFSSIKDEKALSSLGGVDFETFNLLKKLISSHGNDRLTLENKLLLFLLKVKLGLCYSSLAVLFCVHRSTATRVFKSLLQELCQKIKSFIFWPPRDVIDKTMPSAFKELYPKCRVIIDCTEIRTGQPNSVEQRIFLYSHYKGTFTVKFLLGITPNGLISFVSKCYGGRASDSFITNDCDLLKLLENDDMVMADKGFPGIRCDKDIIILMPPFVHDGGLTREEAEETRQIASLRIHVERCIQRIKNFHILQRLPTSLLPFVDDIVTFCCALTNLQPPIIKEPDDDDDD